MSRSHPPLVALLGLVGTLAACEPAPACDGYCGTAVIVTIGDVGTLYPPVIGTNQEWEVADQIFLRLADMGLNLNTVGDQGFVPKLASSWTFEDSVTIAFRIDSAARWQDGQPVTAEDVAFTFAVYRDPATNSSAGHLLDRIVSVTARDKQTAVFRFTHPYVEQFFDATHHMRILPKHILDTIPPLQRAGHEFARHPIGSGPYRLVRWVSQEAIELAADSNFFLGRPGLARLIWRTFPDGTGMVAPLETGEADITGAIIGPPNVDRARQIPHIRVIEYPSPYYGYMGFNFRNPADRTRPHPLFHDRALRRALTMAIDRVAITRAVWGEYAVPAKGPMGPMLRTFAYHLPQIPYDSAAARAELARLGWRDHDGDGVLDRDGQALRFDVIAPASSGSRIRSAVLIQGQLQPLGVAVNVVELAPAVFGQRAQDGDFDAIMMTWGTDPTPSTIVELWTTDGIAASNWDAYSNPEFDRYVEQARNARDSTDERTAWEAAYRIFLDDAPAILLSSPLMNAAVHTRFENVTIRPDLWATTLWTWRIRPGAMIDRDRLVRRDP